MASGRWPQPHVSDTFAVISANAQSETLGRTQTFRAPAHKFALANFLNAADPCDAPLIGSRRLGSPHAVKNIATSVRWSPTARWL